MSTGITGPTGPRGPAGEPGRQGPMGLQGLKGEKGSAFEGLQTVDKQILFSALTGATGSTSATVKSDSRFVFDASLGIFTVDVSINPTGTTYIGASNVIGPTGMRTKRLDVSQVRVADATTYVDISGGRIEASDKVTLNLVTVNNGNITTSGDISANKFTSPPGSANVLGNVTLQSGKVTATSAKISGMDVSNNGITVTRDASGGAFLRIVNSTNTTDISTGVTTSGALKADSTSVDHQIGGITISNSTVTASVVNVSNVIFSGELSNSDNTKISSIGGVEVGPYGSIRAPGRFLATATNLTHEVGNLVVYNNTASLAGDFTANRLSTATTTTSNSIGGVTLQSNNVTAQNVTLTGTGLLTAPIFQEHSVGGVTLCNSNVTARNVTLSGTGVLNAPLANAHSVGGVTLQNSNVSAQNVTLTGTGVLTAPIGTQNRIGGFTIQDNGISTASPNASVSLSGTGSSVGASRISATSNGTVGAPAIGVRSEGNGMYFLTTTNTPALTASGFTVLSTTSTDVCMIRIRVVDSSSSSAPSVGFATDSNTGIFAPASSNFGITTAGTERLRIDASGRVGINTNAPVDTFDVSGVITNKGGSTNTSNGYVTLNRLPDTGSNSTGFVNFVTGNAVTVGYIGRGNNSNKTLDFGSADASVNLLFRTSNTERMRVTNNGRVGIGTSNPVTSLQVNANVAGDGGFVYDSSALLIVHPKPTSGTVLNDPTAVLYLARQGTDSSSYPAMSAFKLSRFENAGGGNAGSRTRLDVTMTHDTFNEVNVMTMRSDGTVGINRTNPAFPLDVDGIGRFSNGFGTANVGGTSGHPFVIDISAAQSGGMRIVASNAQIQLQHPGVTGLFRMYSSATSFGLSTDNTTLPCLFHTSNTERMRIDATGRVGIGTNAPARLFDISTSTNADGMVIRAPTAISLAYRISNLNGEGVCLGMAGVNDDFITGTLSNSCVLRNNFASGAIHFGGPGVIAQTILSSGKVGIGTSAPAYTLDVSGTSKANQFMMANTALSLHNYMIAGAINIDGTGNTLADFIYYTNVSDPGANWATAAVLQFQNNDDFIIISPKTAIRIYSDVFINYTISNNNTASIRITQTAPNNNNAERYHAWFLAS